MLTDLSIASPAAEAEEVPQASAIVPHSSAAAACLRHLERGCVTGLPIDIAQGGLVAIAARFNDPRRSGTNSVPAALRCGIHSIGEDFDGPCRDRTYDLEIKSLLLYQLS